MEAQVMKTDITHFEKDIQVQSHQQELMQKAARWRLVQDTNPRTRRRAILTLMIRVLSVLRLWR
jgi:hypothetical protein